MHRSFINEAQYRPVGMEHNAIHRCQTSTVGSGYVKLLAIKLIAESVEALNKRCQALPAPRFAASKSRSDCANACRIVGLRVARKSRNKSSASSAISDNCQSGEAISCRFALSKRRGGLVNVAVNVQA
jgi:hypothetical protein